MLKTIAAPAPELVNFLEGLELPLNHPQQRPLCQIADGLITTQGSKTLSALYRHMVGNPCPKSTADTFREAPWQADDIRIPLHEYLVKMAFELADATNAPKRIFVSIDDSLTVKDKGSHRLQAVDWHFDHTNSWPDHPAYTKGTVYVLLRLTIGNVSFTVDIVPYLRAKTVRRLNRDRDESEQLTYRSKIISPMRCWKSSPLSFPMSMRSISSATVGMPRPRCSSGAERRIGMSSARFWLKLAKLQ